MYNISPLSSSLQIGKLAASEAIRSSAVYQYRPMFSICSIHFGYIITKIILLYYVNIIYIAVINKPNTKIQIYAAKKNKKEDGFVL